MFHDDNLHLIKKGNEKFAIEINQLIKKIRNDVGVVGSRNHTHPLFRLPHTPSHLSTLTPPIGKINNVKIPKWEECEYIHTPSTPSPLSLPLSSSSLRPPMRPHSSLPASVSSSAPPDGAFGDDVGVGEGSGGCYGGGGNDDDEGSDGSHSSSTTLLSSIPMSFLLLMIFLKNLLVYSCKNLLNHIYKFLICLFFLIYNFISFFYTNFYIAYIFLYYLLFFILYAFYHIYKFLTNFLFFIFFRSFSFNLLFFNLWSSFNNFHYFI